MTAARDLLACPLDGMPLSLHGVQWGCEHGHRFDAAAQGYVNLLPVQHKRSLDPGDSKAMVAARRRFLQTGHYQPIARQLALCVQHAKPQARPWTCLDAGSGEGYYLGQLRQCLPAAEPVTLIGLDISKWAVLAAAKQCRQTTWIVGTNAHLPIRDASLDMILCLFGFPVYAEFARTLRPGGHLIQVDAGADHLRELRALIYDQDRSPPTASEPTGAPGFAAVARYSVCDTIRLRSSQAIADLLLMTPHFYRATPAARERVLALDELELTVDVDITDYLVEPNRNHA